MDGLGRASDVMDMVPGPGARDPVPGTRGPGDARDPALQTRQCPGTRDPGPGILHPGLLVFHPGVARDPGLLTRQRPGTLPGISGFCLSHHVG